MSDAQQLSLTSLPEQLDRYIAQELAERSQQAEVLTPAELLQKVQDHLEAVRARAEANPMIHLALAEAIAHTFEQLVSSWDALPSHALPWLKGAMLYFAEVNDDANDFESPIGFEDDTEVLNACLNLAGQDDLCLNPEDFD